MIRPILFVVLLVLAAAHLWRSIEPFWSGSRNPVPTNTRVLSAECTAGPATEMPQPYEAPADDDPRDTLWIASWSPADRAARRGHNCQVHYTEAGPEGTIIQTVSRSCEAGMAHTRPGDRIVMPDSIPLPAREETLRHEMIHIYQRRQPEDWYAFYRRAWDFTVQKEPPAGLPDSLRDARRSNPDTFDAPWSCWRGRWWPVPVYRNPQTPTLRDATTVWWDAADQRIQTTAPADWTGFFGSPAQNEHPHEIAAVMLTAEDTSSEAGRRLVNWWRS